MKMDSSADQASLSEEKKIGLIPAISLKAELVALEAEACFAAALWLVSNTGFHAELLAVSALRKLHRKMFAEIWESAGELRSQAVGRGAAPKDILRELERCFKNTANWIEDETYEPDEIAIRFHHELSRIRPFQNGNGRLARLFTNTLLERERRKRFTWGGVELSDESEQKRDYVSALEKMDVNPDDLRDLLRFARS
jgi:Fic-DOC domain mobile mystery protein B